MSSQHKKKGNASQKTQTLRIIGGKWRGRLLNFPDVEGLRPSGSRIRETLFNWLAPHLPSSRCLDLYAGSGALGFEAISRGASFCQMLELNTAAAKQLAENAQKLDSNAVQVLNTDTLKRLLSSCESPFDVVFLDPPFVANLWQKTFERLEQGMWLREGSLIYFEAPKTEAIAPPQGWTQIKQKIAGQVQYGLIQFNPANSGSVTDES